MTLGGCAVAGDFFSAALGLNQEFKQLSLCLLDLFGKTRIRFQSRIAGSFLTLAQSGDPRADRLRGIFLVPAVDSQRTSVGRKFFHIKERQSMRREDFLCREERKIGKVFVIYCVELVFLH